MTMRSGSLTISEDIAYSSMDRNVHLHKHRTKIRIATIVVLIVVALVVLFTFILNRRNINEIDDKITVEKLTSVEERCSVLSSRRFDCFPRGNPSQDLCTKRGCCWHVDDNQSDVPKCFFPLQYNSYKYVNVTEHDNGITAFMKLNITSPYPDNIELVQLEVKYLSEYQLNVKIFDPTTKRYEPSYPKLNLPTDDKKLKKLRYIVKINQNKLGFQVIRTENNTIIFDSEDMGGFIFANQFLQLSALLPSKYIYGLGHQRNKFLLNMDWKIITLFNHDLPPTDEAYIKTDKPNFYSSHPFYLVMEEDSLSHGVLLLNSNAMDIILQPAPAITFRTIGGIIDLYFFLGPSPSKVISQYTELVGRPYMPPYWSLGFHLSRLGYGSVNVTREVLDNNRLMGIPVDTQWNDLDYMDRRNDFTFDKNTFGNIKNFVEYLHHEEMHYVILVDPGISAGEPSGSYPPYDEGISKNVFIMDDKNEKPFVCRVWNRSNKTVFPDFTNPDTDEYWKNQIEEQYSKQFKFDGIWLDMNEPTNFINGSFDGCPNTVYDFPPYLPRVDGDLLSCHTICMSARHHGGLHYDLHNVHGITQTASTTRALEHITNKRAFVLTRATFPGSGHYSGTWTGDVSSTWDDMRYSVADILSFSLFGIPLVGADICGFNYNTTVPLCQRWSELGAFYPFSRNHNSDDTVVQDPFTLGHDVIAAAKKALSIRYSLLPYLYTLFWLATTTGSTVARPVFFEFPEDKQTYSQYQQFFWGSALLILPVLFENETTVTAYLPKGIWFDYYTKQLIKSNGEYQLISAPLDTIPLLYRGGNIIPTQEHSSTVAASRRNKMGLTVVPNEMNYATGTLFWDDGESLNTYKNKLYNLVKFKLSGNILESNVIWWGNIEQQPLGTITIIGVNEIVKTVKINDKKTDVNFVYDGSMKTLWIEDLSLTFKEPFVITWTSAE